MRPVARSGSSPPPISRASPSLTAVPSTPNGNLFTTEVGAQGLGGPATGQLILWFPDPVKGFARFPGPEGAYPATNQPSDNFCILARNLATAGAVALDADDSVYVAEASGFRVTRFVPPFPTGLGPGEGCERRDGDGAPLADAVQREIFVTGTFSPPQIFTPTGLAFAPNGNLYVGRRGERRDRRVRSHRQLPALDPPAARRALRAGHPLPLPRRDGHAAGPRRRRRRHGLFRGPEPGRPASGPRPRAERSGAPHPLRRAGRSAAARGDTRRPRLPRRRGALPR